MRQKSARRFREKFGGGERALTEEWVRKAIVVGSSVLHPQSVGDGRDGRDEERVGVLAHSRREDEEVSPGGGRSVSPRLCPLGQKVGHLVERHDALSPRSPPLQLTTGRSPGKREC
jgi:hypothetical protein